MFFKILNSFNKSNNILYNAYNKFMLKWLSLLFIKEYIKV